MYTVWLKRQTPQNIVIGGAAGALPPVIGWAAATGEIGLEPLILFLIIFLWTPPHFWALSLNRSDEYARAGVPMLPVVAGRAATTRQILIYSVLLVTISLLPGRSGLPARSTARLPSSLERRSLCSRGNCAGPARPTGEPLTACSRFPSSYLFVLFAALLASNIGNRWSSMLSARAAPTDVGSVQARSAARPLRIAHSPPASAQTRSEMRYSSVLAVLIIGAATLGGCTEGVLDPKGPIAAAERQILFNSLGIMLAIVIPTILATLGVACWFRASNARARYLPDFELFRPPRDAGLVDPRHDGAAGRRRRLGRRARPRSAQAHRL